MTGGQVETILYESVKAMAIPITGSVYYRGMRPEQNPPLGTGLEDAVVAVITGTEDQIQQGSCVVNVYVPDTLGASGAYYRSKARTDEVESMLVGLPELLSVYNTDDIVFMRNSMILTLPEQGIHQHIVSLKMDFRLLNENY